MSLILVVSDEQQEDGFAGAAPGKKLEESRCVRVVKHANTYLVDPEPSAGPPMGLVDRRVTLDLHTRDIIQIIDYKLHGVEELWGVIP